MTNFSVVSTRCGGNFFDSKFFLHFADFFLLPPHSSDECFKLSLRDWSYSWGLRSLPSVHLCRTSQESENIVNLEWPSYRKNIQIPTIKFQNSKMFPYQDEFLQNLLILKIFSSSIGQSCLSKTKQSSKIVFSSFSYELYGIFFQIDLSPFVNYFTSKMYLWWKEMLFLR